MAKKLTAMLTCVRERGTRSTYYVEFTEESKSGFRFAQFHSVSKIRLVKHNTVVSANQIAPFRSRAHNKLRVANGNMAIVSDGE